MIPPPVHRGITVLNRDLFRQTLNLAAVRIPAPLITQCLKVLAKDLFNQPKLRNVVGDAESTTTKCVLLKTEIGPEAALGTPIADLEPLSKESKEFIEKEGLGIVSQTIELKYEYWTADEILRAILPEDLGEVPSSFTVTGHIAHMNLRDEFLPWKTLIGQIILDKNRNITSVVNKLDVIDSTFRNFRMEVLAGEDNMIAEVVRDPSCVMYSGSFHIGLARSHLPSIPKYAAREWLPLQVRFLAGLLELAPAHRARSTRQDV
ncbi:Met-10+ like-protein-domain-containing protein [Jimgerdemannia flammicorona]|uniref:Met-10+ like-protein-domain-containing protein n=1 Tax=Jimgerdemannia flammicorona TaxID=994334 RepID=A0A433DEE2_9FUNG|nr:Met-10+ like-protein-domain-containing protein [Jimgerdemannia flammicorona]